MSSFHRHCPGVTVAGLIALLVVLVPGVSADTPKAGAAAGLAVLKGVRVHDAPDYTRLVLETSAPIEFRLGGRGAALQIAFNNLAKESAGSSFDFDQINLADSRITALSLTRGRGNRAKLLLPTRGAFRAETFRLAPVASYGHRLVVDLFVDAAVASAHLTGRKTVPKDKRAIVIALDAGHGGEDPGTLGAGGVREAIVVMEIARKVALRLQRTAGVRVVLVRDGDYYVRHDERLAKARAARADLFVSLHADAFLQADVQGASVYALSSGGASSEAAKWLAAKDSRSDLIGGVESVVDLKNTDAALAQVLLDLSMEAQRNASLNLADALLEELAGSVELHKYTVEQASFVVLKSPDIPSVLVETGFLSNPEEALRLSSPQYQSQLADAIAQGLVNYVMRFPPPGSLIASQHGPKSKPSSAATDANGRRTHVGRDGRRRHVIQPGDSLSEVAELYGVSTKELRRANALASDRIKVGQVLAIPAP